MKWLRRLHDAIILDWICNTRRSFEHGRTDEELFEEYLGRKPVRQR